MKVRQLVLFVFVRRQTVFAHAVALQWKNCQNLPFPSSAPNSINIKYNIEATQYNTPLLKEFLKKNQKTKKPSSVPAE